MTDNQAEILFQSFLREVAVSSSGMGGDVHSSMLSIQHFLCPSWCHPPSKVTWGMVLERLSSVTACGTQSSVLRRREFNFCIHNTPQWDSDPEKKKQNKAIQKKTNKTPRKLTRMQTSPWYRWEVTAVPSWFGAGRPGPLCSMGHVPTHAHSSQGTLHTPTSFD